MRTSVSESRFAHCRCTHKGGGGGQSKTGKGMSKAGARHQNHPKLRPQPQIQPLNPSNLNPQPKGTVCWRGKRSGRWPSASTKISVVDTCTSMSPAPFGFRGFGCEVSGAMLGVSGARFSRLRVSNQGVGVESALGGTCTSVAGGLGGVECKGLRVYQQKQRAGIGRRGQAAALDLVLAATPRDPRPQSCDCTRAPRASC